MIVQYPIVPMLTCLFSKPIPFLTHNSEETQYQIKRQHSQYSTDNYTFPSWHIGSTSD